MCDPIEPMGDNDRDDATDEVAEGGAAFVVWCEMKGLAMTDENFAEFLREAEEGWS